MPVLSVLTEEAHVAVRTSRRIRGRVQLRGLSVSGQAPSAVIAGLRAATLDRPSATERYWIKRIELLRQLLRMSPQPLEIVDPGAGEARDADTGAPPAQRTTSRTVGEMTNSSKPPRWAYLLFRLIRELHPSNCLEMGSCVGISAGYQAAALEMNGHGRLMTLEGVDVLAERSARTLDELGLDHRATVRLGHFSDTLSHALTELRPLDWAFIDGDHREQPTIDYMHQVLSAVAPEAVLVFDDINWSAGMGSAWRRIVGDHRFAMTVDLRSVGLAVVSESATERRNLAISYY